MEGKGKVVVGISGGVDSAVAACLLKKEGWEVSGLTIGTLDTPENQAQLHPSPLRISDREEFAIPVFSLNLSARFAREVIDYFQQGYLAGMTPNPCMVCNKKIKWAGLLEGADLLGARMVATGHYAVTAYHNGRHRLYKGADTRKDQSYFLWMLGEQELSRTLLPLGRLTKPEVRELAHSFGVRSAERKESQEICFVPHDDYRAYLAHALPGLEERLSGGDIINPEGTVIGRHRGYPFYTIGQRRGLGVATGEATYVTGIDPLGNRIKVGPKQALQCGSLIATSLHWIGIDPPQATIRASARIRYRDTETPCTIEPLGQGRAMVRFEKEKSAPTPGQAIVFYCMDEVLGGGIISKTLPITA